MNKIHTQCNLIFPLELRSKSPLLSDDRPSTTDNFVQNRTFHEHHRRIFAKTLNENDIYDLMDHCIDEVKMDVAMCVGCHAALQLSKTVIHCLWLYKSCMNRLEMNRLRNLEDYYDRITILLAIYTDLELKGSIARIDTFELISNRITLNYYTFLQLESTESNIDRLSIMSNPRDPITIIDIFFRLQYIVRSYYNIIHPLFQHHLLPLEITATYVTEIAFIKRLIVYKRWYAIDDSQEIREAIQLLFDCFKLKDSFALRELGAYLPAGTLTFNPNVRPQLNSSIFGKQFALDPLTKVCQKDLAQRNDERRQQRLCPTNAYIPNPIIDLTRHDGEMETEPPPWMDGLLRKVDEYRKEVGDGMGFDKMYIQRPIPLADSVIITIYDTDDEVEDISKQAVAMESETGSDLRTEIVDLRRVSPRLESTSDISPSPIIESSPIGVISEVEQRLIEKSIKLEAITENQQEIDNLDTVTTPPSTNHLSISPTIHLNIPTALKRTANHEQLKVSIPLDSLSGHLVERQSDSIIKIRLNNKYVAEPSPIEIISIESIENDSLARNMRDGTVNDKQSIDYLTEMNIISGGSGRDSFIEGDVPFNDTHDSGDSTGDVCDEIVNFTTFPQQIDQKYEFDVAYQSIWSPPDIRKSTDLFTNFEQTGSLKVDTESSMLPLKKRFQRSVDDVDPSTPLSSPVLPYLPTYIDDELLTKSLALPPPPPPPIVQCDQSSGISYPSTRMLSIANLEGQPNDVRWLPPPSHTIQTININNSATVAGKPSSDNDLSNIQTFNINPPSVSNCSTVQTFNILPSMNQQTFNIMTGSVDIPPSHQQINVYTGQSAYDPISPARSAPLHPPNYHTNIDVSNYRTRNPAKRTFLNAFVDVGNQQIVSTGPTTINSNQYQIKQPPVHYPSNTYQYPVTGGNQLPPYSYFNLPIQQQMAYPPIEQFNYSEPSNIKYKK